MLMQVAENKIQWSHYGAIEIMMWLVQMVAILGAVTNQAGGVVRYVESLPPTPNQSQLTCRELVWEQKKLTPVAGSQIHNKLAPSVNNLIIKARSEGIGMSVAVAYRSCDYQLQLRAINCGLGNYNIYQKPSELCTPPTELAGKSMHNEGLAVDFVCDGYSLFEYSPCLAWLKQHAGEYYLLNHPVEAWHWSTTGA